MNSLTLKEWADIFRSFKQVAHVDINDERLDIAVQASKDGLCASAAELNAIYQQSNLYPHEVVTSFLKKHEILIYYQNTLVAYFDIQAYSVFIKKSRSHEAIKKINYLFSEIRNSANTDFFSIKLDLAILSDSIILVIDTNRHPLHSGSLEFFLRPVLI